MADEAGAETKSHLTRALLTPGLLLLAIAGWFWASQTPAGSPILTTTPRPTATVAASAVAEQGLVGLATPWATGGDAPSDAVTTTPPPTPTGAPEPIVVLGPPAGSLFRAGDTVSFYWEWPRPLAGEQRFVLYVAAAGLPVAVAEVDAANLGSVYQAQAAAGAAMSEAGTYQWWVVLEDAATGQTLGQSAPRPIGTVGG